MNFWGEMGLDLKEPSVQEAIICGRRCVAVKQGPYDPTTYIYPIDPDKFTEVCDLAIEMYTCPDLSRSQQARAALLRLTTSEETPSYLLTQSDTPVHICIVDGPVKNYTP